MASISLRRLMILIAIFGLLMASVLAFARWLDPFDDRPFNSDAWFSNRLQDRGYMARDVMRLVHGRSKREVIELLGPGGPTSYSHQNTSRKRLRGFDGIAYDIGSWSFQGMDDAWINIHFDAEGRVTHAEIDGH